MPTRAMFRNGQCLETPTRLPNTHIHLNKLIHNWKTKKNIFIKGNQSHGLPRCQFHINATKVNLFAREPKMLRANDKIENNLH
jgi:hypothetical protein